MHTENTGVPETVTSQGSVPTPAQRRSRVALADALRWIADVADTRGFALSAATALRDRLEDVRQLAEAALARANEPNVAHLRADLETARNQVRQLREARTARLGEIRGLRRQRTTVVGQRDTAIAKALLAHRELLALKLWLREGAQGENGHVFGQIAIGRHLEWAARTGRMEELKRQAIAEVSDDAPEGLG